MPDKTIPNARHVLPRDADPRSETQRQLNSLVETLTQENRRLTHELREVTGSHVAAEQSSSDLVKLCVAHERLHGAYERAEVMAGLEEIVSAVIGCEEFVVVERTAPPAPPRITHAMGLAPCAVDELPDGGEAVRRALATGERTIADHLTTTDDATAPGLTAAIPLRCRTEIVGVLVLYRMLPQKRQLDPLDHALFDLLAGFAGKALHSADLHARAGLARA